MKITALFGSRHQDRYFDEVETLIKLLLGREKELALCIEERFYNYIQPLTPEIDWSRIEVFTHLSTAPDLALSIGGDGTFLRVAKQVTRFGTPILGINTGHLGYLAGAAVSDAAQLIDDIIAGNYHVEPRTALKVSTDSTELKGTRYALNEVALLRRDTASMIEVEASLDGEPLACYRGDGLIVSTPTGSTGYNLSVGGPLVAPSTHCWIVSPIAPHSLNMRPLVIPDNGKMVLRSQGRAATLLLSLDGKATVLPIDTTITVDRAPFDIKLVLMPGQSFIHTIRTKLMWGTQQ